MESSHFVDIGHKNPTILKKLSLEPSNDSKKAILLICYYKMSKFRVLGGNSAGKRTRTEIDIWLIRGWRKNKDIHVQFNNFEKISHN